MTERGLRWFMVALAVALATGLLTILFVFTVIVMESWSPLFLVEDAAGLTVIVMALLGFRAVRRGQAAHGTAHASSLHRALVALVLAGVSEAFILVSGIVLGFGIPVHVIIISGSYPPSITLEWILRMVHFAGYILVAIFVGLFLLWTIWHLAAGVPRAIAVIALLSAVPTPIINLVDVSFLLPPSAVPLALLRVAVVLPVVSVSLWLIAYLLVIVRLRSGNIVPTPAAASN